MGDSAISMATDNGQASLGSARTAAAGFQLSFVSTILLCCEWRSRNKAPIGRLGGVVSRFSCASWLIGGASGARRRGRKRREELAGFDRTSVTTVSAFEELRRRRLAASNLPTFETRAAGSRESSLVVAGHGR